MRYQFDLQLNELHMVVPYEVTCQAIWKKDQKRLESKKNPPLGKNIHIADFGGETLSMISSLFKEK
jgi:hypothetical protein